jgi:hypothetical protein
MTVTAGRAVERTSLLVVTSAKLRHEAMERDDNRANMVAEIRRTEDFCK